MEQLTPTTAERSHDALAPASSESQPSLGSRAVFIDIYDEYSEKIYRYHYYRLRSREVAEDLASQTFLKALEGFHSFDASKGSAATWLYRIARNTFIDHLRKTRPSEDIDRMSDIIPSMENVAADVATRQEVAQAMELLQRVTPEQRSVIMLRLWDELPYGVIAEVTGKTTDACKMIYRRGLDALRKHAKPLVVLLLVIHSFI